VVAWTSPVRGPFPADITIRDDAEVLLRFPYEVLLADEWSDGYYAIRNLGDKPLTIQATPPVYTGDLVFFEARADEASPVIADMDYWPNWELLTSRNPLKHLEKNEYEWYEIIRTGYAGSIASLSVSTRESRVGFLTGPDEWVFSEWTPIRRINERIEDGDVLLEFTTPMGSFSTVRMCEVQGVNYIFLQRRRIARVPEGATPRAVWDNEAEHLTIHFDDVDIPAVVYHYLQPVEWTPETVPHMAVLEDLKAELERARDLDTATTEPDPVAAPPPDELQTEPEAVEAPASPAPPPQSPEDVPSDPADESSPSRLLWPLLLILLIVGGATLALKHKRQRC